MSYLWRLSRGPSKPYNSKPRIDWSHPLAQSLSIYCYDMGGCIIDLVNGGLITVNGTSGLQQSQPGPVLRIPLTGFGNMPPLPAGESRWGGTAPFTGAMATVFVGNSGPTNPDSVVVSIQDAGNTENTAFGFNTFDTTHSANGNNNVAAVFANASAVQYVNNKILLNTFQSWCAVAASGSVAHLYANGKHDSDFAGTTTDTSTPNGQVMYNTASINAGQTFGNGINGFVYYFAMWSRALSQEEALSLHQDPYQFLIYPEDDFDIVGIIAAADTLMAQILM